MMKLSYHSFLILFIAFFSYPSQAQQLSPQEKKIEELMEIQYLNQKTRSKHDITRISGSDAYVQIWRDLPPEPKADEIECLGYQWLLSGRGAKIGNGVNAVFKAIPELQTFTLQLVDLSFSSESLDKHGKLKPKVESKVYLRLRVDRSEIQKYSIDTDRVKRELRSNTDACLKIGRKLKMEREIAL